MPSNDKIQGTVSGAVARLLLNKPEKLNALDEEMLAAIERLFDAWEAAGEVFVVIVGSAGDRAFCVGADIEVLSRMNQTTMQAWEMLGNRVLDRIQDSPLLSIAAIRGHALGGGLTLAAACDFRIAAEPAAFAQPEIDLGWVPGWGGVARLGRLVGPARAKELCVTGRRIDAHEARSIGLVNDVAPPAEFERRIDDFAGTLASRSAPAIRAIKSLADGKSAHRFDALLNASLLNDPRGQAAIARFLTRKSGKTGN